MVAAGSYDGIIIGAGHNGLVAAAYLARAGLRMLVLERRGIVGGACVTEEVWPGFHVSTTSYVNSMFQGRIIEDLGLGKFGFELIPTDNLFVPFEDGRYMVLWDDERKTCSEIAKFSRKDAERYPDYSRFLREAAAFVRELIWKTPPASLGPRSAKDMLELGWKLRRMGGGAFRFIDLMTGSIVELLDKWFESDQLKATLAYYGSIGAFKGPMTPGSAYVLLHHLMGEHKGAGGWGFIRGGMGGLTQALAACARSHGATILTDAEIARVIVRGGRAVGVELVNGDVYLGQRGRLERRPQDDLPAARRRGAPRPGDRGRSRVVQDVQHRVQDQLRARPPARLQRVRPRGGGRPVSDLRPPRSDDRIPRARL